ncbi:MAG: thiamine pyrophosphate-dependent enzyme [Syntrophales bacterium]|jgi:indolepyruvate ferredoxin oxidoreductase alpha subunit|nr:thiamine pyrophosphate-dependent enzyme [Syntrophales bacterium]MCK9528625.1 thiamine pyrophosphate-dependent enzyme [Syntrophales bacterium]MDX9923066.1 thiamine pyrophosphate-dependent enzyme [Syntrophales bacterium]
MSKLIEMREGELHLLMGNEALARGALEAGMQVAAAYPGTPSSEILKNLAGVASELNLYVEWSTNEKVALEVAAAASFASLRSLCIMKQNGVNVASDFLLHLAGSGIRGGMVLVCCDDPGALSSVNEGESRHFARMIELPLLEPGDFQESKDLMAWAFELSEQLGTLVMLRSVTRLSHASGMVRAGRLPPGGGRHADFRHDGPVLDPREGPMISLPVEYKHDLQQERVCRARDLFEHSSFNTYEGPENPELLVISSSVCSLYSREAIHMLNLAGRAGLLKLATTWPLPPDLLGRHLSAAGKILVVEEVLPFLEENVKVLAAERAADTDIGKFYGKSDGRLPMTGELSPDIVAAALRDILDIHDAGTNRKYEEKDPDTILPLIPRRGLSFCPGCPHRASYWSIRTALKLDGRRGFVCGDIGCYTLDVFPGGANTLKTLHSMGSGTGVASGFGQLSSFGLDRPVLAVCGDSTFFHAAMPAVVNAIHHRARITMVILDNSGTAMTGFQPHPGLPVNAMGQETPAVDIQKVCEAMGARVEVRDPFDLASTQETLNALMENNDGLNILILRQSCSLSPEKRGSKTYNVRVDETLCIGEDCGCNRLCTRLFRCPALLWDRERGKARIDEVLCVGCGVCASICPRSAILKEVPA